LPGPAAPKSASVQPLRNRHNQAGLFRQRDELCRADQAQFGLVSAQERFASEDAVAAQIHLRLKVERELPRFNARRNSF